MSFSYEIGPTGQAPVSSLSPYWILVVIPFENRFTIDMTKLSVFEQDITTTQAKESPAKSTEFMLLDNHCVQWTVSSSKSSHVHTASFTLVPPEVIHIGAESQMGVPYYSFGNSQPVYKPTYNIAPQDWVMFWAMNDKDTYDNVKESIVSGLPSNDAMSGLKFVGKAVSFRTNVSISENGQKINRYSLECASFREFDNTIYYNPMANPSDRQLKTVNDLVGDINAFLGNSTSIYVSTQEAFFKLISLFFDIDFKQSVLQGAYGTEELRQAIASFASENKPYLVPDAVLSLLGVEPSALNSYSKILYKYAGIEEADLSGTYTIPTGGGIGLFTNGTATIGDTTYRRLQGNKTQGPLESYHTKDLNKVAIGNETYLNSWEWPVSLSAKMIKQTLHFDNRSIWSILTTYLNEPVDEMYTTLKLTPVEEYVSPFYRRSSKIMPSVICRQLPFTSTSFAGKEVGSVAANLSLTDKLGYTRFVDLPRWKINDSYVTSYGVGLSDTADINYVHLEPFLGQQGLDIDLVRAALLVYSPPIIDTADISKNGLRMYQRTLASTIFTGFFNINKSKPPEEGIRVIKWWNALMADIMMRMRYMANGSVVCKGIQEPICIGDNASIYGTLFHIENVAHEGAIDTMGHKYFNTSLGLSMGVSLKNIESTTENPEANFVPNELKTNRVEEE